MDKDKEINRLRSLISILLAKIRELRDYILKDLSR